jgi:hypothetical protein
MAGHQEPARPAVGQRSCRVPSRPRLGVAVTVPPEAAEAGGWLDTDGTPKQHRATP